tara:strand:+ start:119 stop:229 length:111 start_codon:yes stop_codon:yes gene_type:complete
MHKCGGKKMYGSKPSKKKKPTLMNKKGKGYAKKKKR